MPLTTHQLSKTEREFGWAVSLVEKRFSKGLASLTDERFLQKRYETFEARNDPIYSELLNAMNDKPLAKAFVSYWTIAHTLASESRSWLEHAIADIVIHQQRKLGRNAVQVYSATMLSHGFLERKVSVADIGENERENLTRGKPWRVLVKQKALETIDVLVGREERLVKKRGSALSKSEIHELRDKAKERDMQDLLEITKAIGGEQIADVLLHCNLLVVEPDKLNREPNVWAFRFANPKTLSSHPMRKQERVNLLRLYALLLQEKPLREASSVRVYVAEILPRAGRTYGTFDRYPDYFTDKTYWDSRQLWAYIGVPFDVVTCAIQNVAAEFRERLIAGLRGLLPTLPSDEVSRTKHPSGRT